MRHLVFSLALAGLAAGAAPAQKPGLDPVGFNDEVDRGRTLPYLAHTLGELHYLAYACEGEQAQQWRNRMVRLLDMEAPSDGRLRARMVDSFNAGYRAQQRYRTRCGAEADAERRALGLRGRDLSEMMRSAYFD
ncbi:TIGR02301 family protein [Maricaulis sp. CAU 1757]